MYKEKGKASNATFIFSYRVFIYFFSLIVQINFALINELNDVKHSTFVNVYSAFNTYMYDYKHKYK